MPELLNPAPVAHLRHLLRAHSPLVHCMTNDVVQTFTANVLLAVGASPAMVIDPREAAQFAAIADALLINVGTLTEDRAVAMRAAVEHARQAGKPWTLDPVAVGALTARTAFCHELLALQPAAIRGNASEILALAGMSAGGRGVDTTIRPLRRCRRPRRWLVGWLPWWRSLARWTTSPTASGCSAWRGAIR